MKLPFKASFISTCLYLALSSANETSAACNISQPTTGQSVICDTAAPNPGTTPVVGATGSSGVSLNNTAGSVLNVGNAAAVSLGAGSTLINGGQLTGTTGILLREGSSVVDNRGAIVGTSGAGVQFNGNGNNTLINSGSVRGVAGGNAVVFGNGNDTLNMTGGTLTGNVDQGNGADKTLISGGTITESLLQGNGIDDFVMTGGTLGSLFQGDNRDTFTLSGGNIVNAFEDGDVATMTGGRIGRVNMRLDNNIFRMSGGEIAGNLVTGLGNDLIIVSGTSVIGGSISVSGGTDSVTMTGGTLRGEIRMSTGNDLFHWEGGSIFGSVLMEADNDRIEFTRLDAATAATSPLIDGGTGDDRLVMTNSQYVYSDAHVLRGIEHIDLVDGSLLTLDNKLLPLGDAGNDGLNTGYTLDTGSTLAIVGRSDTTLRSHLGGSGTVVADTGGNAFGFDDNNAADNFAGTVELRNSRFDLSGVNTLAMSQATLKAAAGSITTVGSGTQTIGGLAFDGGTVDFGRLAPGDRMAANTLQTRRELNLGGSGTVRVGVDGMLNTPSVNADNVPLLAQDDGSTQVKLAASNGTVTGNASGLVLTRADGSLVTDALTVGILQDGASAAQGIWDWRLSAGEAQDGLYIAYALKQVNLEGTGDTALVLNSEGATGNAADLGAKVTGSGDVAIENAANGTVSLSNRDNDYTGTTYLRTGQLLMNNDRVLGNTALLQMAAATTLDMNGYSQGVGRIAIAESSQVDLNGGSLVINQGGRIAGRLLGEGMLTLNNGILDINGDNSALMATTHIQNGATVNLDNAAGLGRGDIDNAGRLAFNGARGQLINRLGNNGDVALNDSQMILAADNRAFGGSFSIDETSLLTAAEAGQLGSATVYDKGSLNLATDTDWTLNNTVTGSGNLAKQGIGVVTLTAASAAYTGKTQINQGGLVLGNRRQPLTLATSEVNIDQGFLAANGAVAGDVNNRSLLRVGSEPASAADALFPVTALATLRAVSPLVVSANNDALTVGGNLVNSGVVQLGQTGSALRPGNALTVNGNYQGNNGRILFNTALGDDNSATDRLSILGDTGGTSYVSVLNAGGSGARTLNGIELIEVGGNSNGQFLQEGRIVAGAYDYRLTRGAGSNQANWYLTNSASTPPGQIPPTPPDSPNLPPTPEDPLSPPADPTLPPLDPLLPVPENPASPALAGGDSDIMLRPEAGSYLENLAAANTMFNTRLHDRLGETQYTDALTGEKQVTSLWLRQVGTHHNGRSTVGSLNTQSNQYVVMLGGDVAQWSGDGQDRVHLGLMAGYGNNQSHTRSQNTGTTSKGQVNGYSVGIYGTWFANNAQKTGVYVDSWAQYSGFKNTVSGEGLPEEHYHSRGVSASLESGYTWKIGQFLTRQQSLETVYVQPQAQIVWMGVKADDHTESNGTQVTRDDNANVQTRLGTRLFMKGHSKGDDGKNRDFQPFVEVNWLHNSRAFSTRLNGLTVSQDGARNIGEVRTGVEGQLSQNLTAWGNVGQQIGDAGYSNTDAMLGIKYLW